MVYVRLRLVELEHNTQLYMYPYMCNGLKFGSDYISRHLNEIKNPFWHDVNKAVIDLYSSSIPNSWDEFLSNPLWFNIDIKVGRTTCFIKEWYDAGISFINNLLDPIGHFFTLFSRERRLCFNVNFIVYEGILAAVRSYLNSLSFAALYIGLNQPICPAIIS